MVRCLLLAALLLLAACAGPRGPLPLPAFERSTAATERGNEIALFALSLIDTGYRFGGKNPEAGLDCSGMVQYIFNKAAGLKLGGSAADLARRGRPVPQEALQPGDLVFFNTLNRPFSHVGIYIGDGRFVHAPSTSGRVRADSLTSSYFAGRYEGARTLVD